MMSDNFLSLCNEHNSIIHEFGCDISCAREAAVCLRGCSEYDHKQKSTKHEFVSAREIYSMVSQIREEFKSFQNDFKMVYLKKYMASIKEAIQDFEVNVLGRFCEDHQLSEFFGKNIDQSIQSLLEDKEDQIEFADLKCKEVFALKQFSFSLFKDPKEDQQKKIAKILTKLFQDHLRSHKLLPPPKQTDKHLKHQLVFQGSQLLEVSESIKKTLQTISSEELKKFNEIVIKLKDNLNQYKDSLDFPKHLEVFEEKKKQLMTKCTPSQIIIAIKGEIKAMPFWNCFLEGFAGTVKIISPQKSSPVELQELKVKANNQKIHLHIAQKDWQKHPQIFYDPN